MTTQVYSVNYTYQATIASYDAVNKVAYLASGNTVNLSLGTNDFYGPIASQYTINGTATNISQAISNGTAPPSLSTDESGNFVGIFNVPPGVFQTGQRIFRVDNRSTFNDPSSATTYAESTFYASGLQSNSQSHDFAPSVDSSGQVFIQSNQINNSLVGTNSTVTSTVIPAAVKGNIDPLAQTFIISSTNYPNGIFINSVKLFFYSKPTTNVPIKLSIIGTLNGYPNGQVLDYSTVILNPNQVLTSTSPHYLDSSTYTEFMFQAPVYIRPGVLYAIMLQSSSSDYQVYYAQQNQIAVPSTAKANPTDANPATPTKIGAAPYVGALFESQNSITWTADQTKDLMFVIDRCIFDTTKTPQIPFSVPKNLPYRKLGINDIYHGIDANSINNLHNTYSPKRRIDALNVTTSDFVPTATGLNYSYQSTLFNGNTPTNTYAINPGKYGTPTPDNVWLNDNLGSRVLNRGATNQFSLYATLSSTDPNVSPIISDDAVSLFTVRYNINNMSISNNTIVITNPGSGYNTTATISISSPDSANGTQAVLGYSRNVATGNITSVYVTTRGSGYYKTPIITISDPTTRGGGNANASIIVQGETSASGGNSLAKYFTKKVVLAPSSVSGDLRVFYGAYQPLGSTVLVYYKLLSPTDTQPFESSNWQLMTPVTNIGVYSTSLSNIIEYEVAPGIFGSGQANNNISYTNSLGQNFNSFSQFAIKVVLAASDPTNPPFLTDIRAIALPPGTGI